MYIYIYIYKCLKCEKYEKCKKCFKTLYIYEPIKCNRFLNRYPSLDHVEMKSQPFKLPKITAMMAVRGGFLRFP
ncbi:hypothetical protein Hanom_Chr15g01401331 [Helianthus anomalus]